MFGGKKDIVMHAVTGVPLEGPYPEPHEFAIFAMGCFWAPESLFWQVGGVHVTAAGFAGGRVRNPTYVGVSGGFTGHVECILVVFDPTRLAYQKLLEIFWENHDPTQHNAQGQYRGRQYRSLLFACSREQKRAAEISRAVFQKELKKAGLGPISTEIRPAPQFWFAEAEHQQFLAKSGNSCVWVGGTGVAYPGSDARVPGPTRRP